MARCNVDRPETQRQPLGPKRAKHIRNTRYNGQGTAASEPVRDHILTLQGYGLTYYAIGRDAGVGENTVQRIAVGRYNRCRISAATAIMAVTWQPNPRQVMVLAIGALRRVRALSRIGWSYPVIAEHSGVSVDVLRDLHNNRTVGWEIWKAIHDTYETLSGTPATTGRHHQTRNRATAKGWPAPLDWEGYNIDDPRVTVEAQPWEPQTYQEQLAERRTQVAQLTEAGLSAAEIADRMGVDARTIVRDRGTIAAA